MNLNIDIALVAKALSPKQQREIHKKVKKYAEFLVNTALHTTDRSKPYIESIDGQRVLAYVKARRKQKATLVEIAEEMNQQLDVFPPARAKVWTKEMIFMFAQKYGIKGISNNSGGSR